MQGHEGAPDAVIEVDARFAQALEGVKAGDSLVILTWLHAADRSVLQVHPRDDRERPLTGVFATRSQDRPNPVGLHPVTVRAIDGTRLTVGPLEAIDGTPVIDIKPAIATPPYATREAGSGDVEFLWQMLLYASHSDEDGVSDPAVLRAKPELARYVDGFGRDGDLGVIVQEARTKRPAGAAWLRLWRGADRGYGYVDAAIPELAIATAPDHRGAGAGTLLMAHLLARAFERFDAVSLSVRLQNPARRLYERFGFTLVAGSEKPNRVGGTSGVMLLRRQ
jgi:tRNA-Thr(GGU) m(6)t(6)A37 methyltransferase TsaA